MSGLKEQLMFEEGLRLEAYHCPTGKLSIGYGHNLDANPYRPGTITLIPHVITHEQAEAILCDDIVNATHDLIRRWPQSEQLDSVRFDACVAMVFQLGISGFMKFACMRDALINGKFKLAYQEAINSAWHTQTPGRCERVATQIRTGKYYDVLISAGK